jgi:hypothetical protein
MVIQQSATSVDNDQSSATCSRVAGLLAAILGAALAASIILAPASEARSALGGQVCTGPQEPNDACNPRPLSQLPPGDLIPVGCKPSSGMTKACGRRASHQSTSAQSANTQANATAR